jgi:hypothetical protein
MKNRCFTDINGNGFFVDRVVERDYLKPWAVLIYGVAYLPAEGRPLVYYYEIYLN